MSSAERRPLAGYGALVALFNLLVAAGALAVRRSGKQLPRRVPPSDVVLVGAATYKLARLITKEKVMAFARAPFTEYQGEGGPAEVEERARGRGLRRAIGELLVCPYCLGTWIATAFTFGLVAAPRATRLVALVFTSVGIADFLQVAHRSAVDR
jgi:hypothetical protein